MKKVLALILSLVLIVLPLSGVLAFAEEDLGGEQIVGDGSDGGDGSEAGYALDEDKKTFTVSTPDGFNAVAALINGADYETYKTYNITLANDLEFVVQEGMSNFTSLGADIKPYCGTFDGAGHTIKGLQTAVSTTASGDRYRALIAQAANCTVKNLTITDSTFTGYEYVSALIAAAVGPVTVTNVHVRNSIILGDLTKGNNVGGLCGRFFEPKKPDGTNMPTIDGDSLFENCTVVATISSFKNAAGICAGEASGANQTITIRNCVVAGTYETKSTASGNGTAGIFGFANGKSKIIIENCVSIAELIAASGEAGSMLSMVRRSEYEIKNSIGYGAFAGFILIEGASGDPVPVSIDAASAVVDPKKEESVNTVSLWGVAPTKEPPERYTLTIGGESKTFVDATTPLIDMDTAKVRIAEMYGDEDLKDFKTMALAFVNDNVPHDHVFDCKNTADKYAKSMPTCQNKGIYYYSCSICGLAGTETFEGETTGHRFASGWSTSETEHWHLCLDCQTEKEGVEEHTFGEWTVKREATEKRDGERECECSVCGYKKTEKIPKLTPATTTAAENQNTGTPAGEQKSTEKKGCGSTLGGGFGMIATVAFAGAVASRKKKERK